MVLDYYHHYMLLMQRKLNGNLHQINNFKVRKKHIRNNVFLCILNMLNLKRVALIATER